MPTQNRTKLIWLIDSLGHGGAELLTETILTHLPRDKYEIRVCALQSKNDNPIATKLSDQNIPVDNLNIRHLRDLGNLPRLFTYLKNHKPDIIHTQLQFSDTLGPVAGWLLQIPSVSTQHTIEPFPPKSKGGRRQKLTWWALRNFANKVITVSDKTRQYHIHAGKLDSSKVLTLYNGIEIKPFTLPSNDIRLLIRDDFGIPEKSIVIITVAVLRKAKGIQNMIAIVPELLDKHRDLVYLVVGDGEYLNAIEEQINQLGLSSNIILAGQRDDIPDLLNASDLFVLPTLTDALPTVLLEAQAARLPIVASNVGGIPEIITHMQTGLLVPPEDLQALQNAVVQALDDPALRNQLAENGFENVNSRFSIENQVRKLTRLYEEVLDGRR